MNKKIASTVARNITRYLRTHGCNQIIMIVKDDNGWSPEVPEDILAIWPNVADLLTEYR